MNTVTYTIEIDGTTALVDEPNNGFVDCVRLWDLNVFNSNTQETGITIPTDLAAGRSKARGYVRWLQLLKDLGQYTTISVSNINYSDGDEPDLDNPPTKIAFDITFDNFDNVKVPDEFNEGIILTDEAAIKRIVAESLCYRRTRDVIDVYDSTITISNNPQGITLNPVVIGPCISVDNDKEIRITTTEAVITVTEVV